MNSFAQPERSAVGSDRDLQDALITYLTDAHLRRSAPTALPLRPEQAQRAGRFARFLARRYYRDRLARSFRYSRRFGWPAETVVDTPAFDAFLNDCALGSLAAAQRVGELALHHLSGAVAPGAWWYDLLAYERLFFLQAATTETAPAAGFACPSLSARCRVFSWDLPRLLRSLKSAETISAELRRGVTLLFARMHTGRIYVVEMDQATASMFLAADGRHDLAQLAQAASLSIPDAQQTLAALRQIGALISS